MTINTFTPCRMRIAEEANGSFATDLSGSLGSFLDCPFSDVDGAKATVGYSTESPHHSQQHIDGYPVEVLMLKSGRLEFTVNLEALTTKVSGTAVQGAVGMLLKIAIGGETLGVGTTITTSASTTSIPCTSAAGIAVGSCVGFATGAGGALEMREVLSKSGNTLTLKLALSNAPANGSVVYSAATYSLGGTSGDQTTSLQATVERLFASDRFLFLGGWIDSFGIEVGPGEIPKLKFGWQFANWLDAATAAANFAGAGALGFATYTNNKTIVVKDSQLRQQTVGTSTFNAASILQAPKFTFNLNLKCDLHKSPSGVNTIRQPIRMRNAPIVSGSFTIPFEDTTWFTARDNRTSKAISLQIGSVVADGGILIAAPTVQINKVELVNQDGITSQMVSWVGRLDEATSGSTTDLARSACRIHIN